MNVATTMATLLHALRLGRSAPFCPLEGQNSDQKTFRLLKDKRLAFFGFGGLQGS